MFSVVYFPFFFIISSSSPDTWLSETRVWTLHDHEGLTPPAVSKLHLWVDELCGAAVRGFCCDGCCTAAELQLSSAGVTSAVCQQERGPADVQLSGWRQQKITKFLHAHSPPRTPCSTSTLLVPQVDRCTAEGLSVWCFVLRFFYYF